MANEATYDEVWNAYINKHNSEPNNAQQFLNFSKNKSNNVTALGFSNARKIFNKNKGKGKVDIVSSNTNSTTPKSPKSPTKHGQRDKSASSSTTNGSTSSPNATIDKQEEQNKLT